MSRSLFVAMLEDVAEGANWSTPGPESLGWDTTPLPEEEDDGL